MRSRGMPHRSEDRSDGVVRFVAGVAVVSALVVAATASHAALTVGQATVDPETVTTLGIQVPVSGDADFDGHIFVRYRKNDTCGRWREAMELHHVNPGHVPAITVPNHFAGSIFNLQPDTEYQIELTAADDGEGVAGLTTQILTARTRPLPRIAPLNPIPKPVHSAAELTTALAQADDGHVIQLDPNVTYTGLFVLPETRSGSPDNPIVIRGAPGAVLDGNRNCPSDCSTGTVLWIRGNHVYVEDLTVTNARRGIYFGRSTDQGGIVETVGNVVRRSHVYNVRTAIGSAANQSDAYICDNTLEGIVPWPAVYDDDNGARANFCGIRVSGSGNVICHNSIKSFGDGIRLEPDAQYDLPTMVIRGVDIYGNDVLSGYDNSIELDYGRGNVRAFRNRLLNATAPLSFQPIYGGPAYAMRNVVVNIVKEPIKFSVDPSGMFVLHNTFVPAPMRGHNNATVAALNQVHGEHTSRDFKVMNNLFIGRTGSSRTVYWWSNFENGLFDYNGYYPDGIFHFGVTGTPQSSLAALKAAGVLEDNGLIAPSNVFQNLAAAPASYQPEIQPSAADVRLNTGVNAPVDAALAFANVNDSFVGSKADLGALERDCSTAPIYGPRAAGVDESNQPVGCESLRPTGCPGEADGPAPQCGASPVTGCRTAVQASVLLKRNADGNERNSLKFAWRKGTSPVSDFGNPTDDAMYSVCIYQTPENLPATLVMKAAVPAGIQGCGPVCDSPRVCWRGSPPSSPTRWSYKDSSNSPDGLRSMKLVSSSSGRAKVDVKGAGDCLGLPASLDLQTPVTVQVVNSATSVCWEAEFDTEHASASPTRYQAKVDSRFVP